MLILYIYGYRPAYQVNINAVIPNHKLGRLVAI